MSSDCIHFSIDDHIATLTINRADKLNALDSKMIESLGAVCRRIDKDDNVRVVILTGEGRKAFSAGGDIAAWGKWDASSFAFQWVRYGHEALDRLARLRQPVIAVLNGHTLGGGLELAACADYRIGERHIKLGQPEAGLGIIAGWSGTQRCVRRFGSQIVRRMAMFGEIFSGEEGLELGLVDQLTDTGSGLGAAIELAEKVKARSPHATQLTKMLVNGAEGEERERVFEALAGYSAATSDELKEGVAAFFEKRKPRF